MKRPGGLVEELVHQFTDPFAFFRELIQNSLDAGSSRVEVSLRWSPGAPKGLAIISVQDWGEGMTREVIENYLVTKFRSTKENDLTKIGKFGIGFVSLFACEPDAVTVDTARDGDAWRVLFKADTSWELLRLDAPFEGTCVTLHKAMHAADFSDFVQRARASIARWCRHAEADIAFSATKTDGRGLPPFESLREPFAVDAPFQVEHREEGTHVVAGPAREGAGHTGFYNRGLTLLETDAPLLPGVALKIDSRYLEHTLTRDDVRRDAHFKKALKLAQKLVDGPLLEQLPVELKRCAEGRDTASDHEALLRFALPRLKPTALWWRQPGGHAIEHAHVARFVAAHRYLLIAGGRTPLVQRLIDAAVPVLAFEPGAPLLSEVQAFFKCPHVEQAEARFTYAAPPEERTPAPFAAALVELLAAQGASIRQVELTPVRGAAADDRFACFEALSVPEPVEQVRRDPFHRKAGRVLVLNAAHDAVAALAPLASSAPRLAAVLCARLVLVSAGRLSATVDQSLATWALA